MVMCSAGQWIQSCTVLANSGVEYKEANCRCDVVCCVVANGGYNHVQCWAMDSIMCSAGL